MTEQQEHYAAGQPPDRLAEIKAQLVEMNAKGFKPPFNDDIGWLVAEVVRLQTEVQMLTDALSGLGVEAE